MRKVFYLCDDLNYSCGISNYLYYFFRSYKFTYDKIFILTSGGDSIDRFLALGIEVIVLKQLSWNTRSYFNYFLACIKLLIFCARKRPSIIHSQVHYVANIARLSSFLLRIPTVQSHHNLFLNEAKLPLFASDYHIAVNDHIKSFYESNYSALLRNEIRLIRCGIEPTDIIFPKGNKRKVIIAAGRFVKEKGFEIYLDAVKLCPKQLFEKAEFYLAGAGDERDYLLEKIKDEKIPVTYMGLARPLKDILRRTDIFVFPGNWQSEGFPLTILEAGITKNLLITSEFIALSDHFCNGLDGLSFPKNNAKMLSEAMLFAIDNYEDNIEMINRFYTYTRKKFSIDISIKRTLDLYSTIIK